MANIRCTSGNAHASVDDSYKGAKRQCCSSHEADDAALSNDMPASSIQCMERLMQVELSHYLIAGLYDMARPYMGPELLHA